MASRADWSRRAFLAWAGSGALAAAAVGYSPARSLARPRFDADPFALGVASGDPAPDGAVLWTRLAPAPLEPGGGMPPHKVPVRWTLAADEHCRRVVRRGATFATPELGHSVHVEVGGLAPDREYFYRFDVGRDESPVGRTRTAPAFGHGDRGVDFAFVSCQDFADGFYTAFRHLAAEDVAFVLHLGDTIYENPPTDEGVRRVDGTGEPVTLEQYRSRHALYRTDPDQQLVYATHPFIVTFDDHEVDNDWSDGLPQDPDEQPPDAWAARRAAAFQGFWENMPLRRSAMPRGSAIPLYRRLRFGGLMEMSVLDTRQFRSLTEPCGYGTGPPCPEVFDPARTMLGAEQERWLLDGLDRSRARWNVIAQQVPLSRIDLGAGADVQLKLDKWDAYPVARDRLLGFIEQRRPSNPMVISGDLHDGWVFDVKRDFEDPASATLSTELVGNSISSDGDGSEVSEDGAAAAGENPHLRFHTNRRGYVRCSVTRERWQADFRILPFVSRPGAPVSTRATFVVDDGRPGVVGAGA
jgi:alkaline phosphatase D